MSIHEECGVFGRFSGRPIGADSPGDLPVERLGELAGDENHCSACFDGRYPTAIPTGTGKNRFEQRLSERPK